MRPVLRICFLLATATLWGVGCASPPPLRQTPLTQDQVDQFLTGGRDPRMYGITVYPDAAGPRFEFANRPHPGQSVRRDFVTPRGLPFPVIQAQSAITDPFPMLLDTSARQTWAVMSALKGLEYRLVAPPTGEYADHVRTEIPGYAGVGNKLIMGKLHMEYPIFYVAPAAGMLGALNRIAPGEPTSAKPTAREKLARKISVVMGAAAMRNFAFVRFDFPARAVSFSVTRVYQPSAPNVVAGLPLRDWRGRPAVAATLDGQPLTLVLDTAGDFDLALPGEHAAAGTLRFGDWAVDVEPRTHHELGLPERFPARLGLGVLSQLAVTLDFKNNRIWFEDPNRDLVADAAPDAAESANPQPIHYRGVRP
ncbi:MAG TPA: hypothetical protein PLD40_05815 [Kiritimatiellia bacterium]|jgi:hypothetical protein|nr:hypothetical protein [Kiritimatiellia bacterium]OQC59171.1 MAG: hypothetical protein BWX54_00754 [Verrucomicrobia bacterium ADurb.Bin018]HPV47084.1 hypothetical protein [Kiritimatiellia bacterium]HQK45186.1 hypothetical protein [Kiritimatiellia bacterium]HQM23742.1 hypothetical protein [Kiritimatiellia bacterium]